MTHNYDRSYKDKKYFIDGSTYNCPFCNRRHIAYEVTETGSYDQSNRKTIYYYLVCCNDCGNTSLHLSQYDLVKQGDCFAFPIKESVTEFDKGEAVRSERRNIVRDIAGKDGNIITELDDVFFYHDPSAFFTIDERIPLKIRAPLSEAINSLKSNFLTGASGCLRKAIYKLLKHEKVPEKKQQDKYFSSEERVNLLKEKYSKIDAEFFDELKAIHALTSQELHENDWEDIDSATLRYLLGVTTEVLYEIYVVPDEKRKQREMLSELRRKAKPEKV